MTTFPDRMGSDGISGGVCDASGPGSCADASSPSVSPLRAAIPIAAELNDLLIRLVNIYDWSHDESGAARREYDQVAYEIKEYLRCAP